MTETTERRAMLDALRIRMAALDGVRIVEDRSVKPRRWKVMDGDRHVDKRWFTKRAWAVRLLFLRVPNYPRDVAAALAVCLEVGAANNWTLEIEKPLSSYCAQFWGGTRTLGDRGPRGDAVTGATVAEALTRLALAALSVKQVTNETGKTPPESAT